MSSTSSHSPPHRNGKTGPSDVNINTTKLKPSNISILNPCATSYYRTRRITQLRYTQLSSSVYPHCNAISLPHFYYALNNLHIDFWNERALRGEERRTTPLLFNSNGSVIPEKYLRRVVYRPQRETKMPSSCQDIRAALAACLQSSDCIMIQRHTPTDCLRPPLISTLPTQCQQLKKGLGECKRGMVDMRKRFRGNQPIAVSKELEGGSSAGGGQLYAGRPAFGDTAHKTDGRERGERDWREVENEREREGKV